MSLGTKVPTGGGGITEIRGQYYSDAIRRQFGLSDSQLLPTPQAGPESNISYYPVAEGQAQQSRDDQMRPSREAGLPPEWPTEFTGIQAWEPDQLNDSSRYLLTLTKTHRVEIRRALEVAKELDSFEKVTRSTFPLEGLGTLLAQFRDQVYRGIGFAVIRGLDLGKFDPNERALVFLGLSSYVADERGPQDRYGTMLKHIMDDERIESLRELPFHTDVTCDLSALLTVACSETGGEWTVASSLSVYNELARTSPDLIRVLAEPDWPFDTFGRDPAYFQRAPLYHCDGKPIFNFSRRLLVEHPQSGRTNGVPKLTEAQAEALDAVHFTARRHSMKFAMQEGDIRFVSNLGLLHGREGFSDNESKTSRRHVMRLWLRNRQLTWKLPPALQLAWARIFDDPERHREWIVEPYTINGIWYGRGPRAECD